MSEPLNNFEAEPPAPPVLAIAPPETAPPPAPKPKRRAPLWPVFCLLGFVLLAGGEVCLWQVFSQAARGQAAGETRLAVLQTQVEDLRQFALRAQPAPDSVTVQADLAQKLTALAAQVNAMQGQLEADHGALATLQDNAATLQKFSSRLDALAALAAAQAALDAGAPLGNIPHAPPALAVFATTPPPTEAYLRENFPAAAQKAEAASLAGAPHAGFWARVRAKFEALITISNGDHVIIGAPAAAVLSQAQAALDAGDLAGGVQKISTLSLPAQQAMGAWLTQARALLAARAALLNLAQG